MDTNDRREGGDDGLVLAYRLVDLLPMQAALVDVSGRLLYANRPWYDLVARIERPVRYDSTFVYFDERDPGFEPGSADARAAVAGVRSVLTEEADYFEAELLCPIEGRLEHYRLLASAISGVEPRTALLVRLRVGEDHDQRLRRHLLESSIDVGPEAIFWVTRDGRLLWVNQAVAESLGNGAGDSERPVWIWDIDPNFDQESWAHYFGELRSLAKLLFRSYHQRRNGDRVPVEVRLRHTQFGGDEYAVGYARRLTPAELAGVESTATGLTKWAADDGLREAQERLDLALQSTSVGLWDWDLVTGRLDFDRHWAAILGYLVEDLEPHFGGWTALVHPDDEPSLRQALEDHLDGLTDDFEVVHRLRHRNGSYRWLLARGKVTARDDEGNALRVAGTVLDITERRVLEERLQQSQKMEAVGQLAGGVAHDFNNLLTAINGYADLVLGAPDADDPNRAKVREIRKAGERAAGLTDRLLAFSRKQLIQPELLDLVEVVEGVRSLVLPALGEHIEMVLDHDAQRPVVNADRGQLEQVILNLAMNARDAMTEGGRLVITVRRAEPSEVEPLAGGAVLPSDYTCLSVADNGPGMEPAVQERVFEPFFTTKDHGEGTGLGLSMVYGAITQSGGFVDLTSDLGVGTEVRVYLPIAHGTPGHEGPRGERAVDAPRAGTEPVLLVEDEDSVRGFLESSLVLRGYRVLTAASAEEANELIESGAFRPDLLVTDIVLPGRNGVELAARLKTDLPGLRVLFVSGYPERARAQLRELGVQEDFLQKPFRLDVLLERVRRLLDQNATSSS